MAVSNHTVIAEETTLVFGSGSNSSTGTLLRTSSVGGLIFRYATGEEEVLSVNLVTYGLLPGPDEVFVKDWSEHAGLAQSLVDAGHAEFVDEHFVGPFKSRAVRLRISRAETTE